MSVISHITLGTNDAARAAAFYDAVLGALGFERLAKPPGKPPAYEKDGAMPTIYLYPPIDGRPATRGNGSHIAFVAETRAVVRAFHALALEHGGTCEGEPGPRPHYGENYYAAYVRTPTATSCRPSATRPASADVRGEADAGADPGVLSLRPCAEPLTRAGGGRKELRAA